MRPPKNPVTILPGKRVLAVAALCVLLGGVPASHAAIVYTTPAIPINIRAGFAPIEFDFDNFGTTDIIFDNNGRAIAAFLQGDNRAVATVLPGQPFAADLPFGFEIGPSLAADFNWRSGPTLINGCVNAGGLSCSGNFFDDEPYLGVEFEIDGQIHYGWVEILSFDFFFHAQLVRWAYETEPGVPIRAGAIPEPGTWGLVILGSLLLASSRRRK